MSIERKDPYAQFAFIVNLGGDGVAGFTEVGGLTAESDIIEYREGNEPARVRKLPGLYKFSNITLKRGYTDNLELWTWRLTTINGLTERRDGSIVLRDEGGIDRLRWNFYNAWVPKYDGAALNSATNEAAIESVELACELVELVKV
jgi:phage tail-like protein